MYRSFYGRGFFDISIFVAILIISFIAAIIVYFVYLNPKNERRFIGFNRWFYNFLNFRTLFVEAFFKVIYISLSIFTTVAGIIIFFSGFSSFGNFITGILTIVLGNIFLRILFEMTLMSIMLFKNTNDIRKKLIDPDGFDNNNSFEGGYAAFDSIKTKLADRAAEYAQSNRMQNPNMQNPNMQNPNMQNPNMQNPNMQNQNLSGIDVPYDKTLCPNCNASLPKGSKFCPICGAKQNNSETAQ